MIQRLFSRIARTAPFRYFLKKFDASPPIKLSASFQRAMLASNVVRLIINAQHPTALNAAPLKEQIINHKPNIEGYECDENIRTEFLKMFTEGVELNRNIFTETRVSCGTQCSISEN
jgi:hypothetical protein